MRWQMDLASISHHVQENDASALLHARLFQLADEPLITLLNETSDIDGAQACVKHFKKRSDTTIVIGTGGASLGAQALLGVALASAPNPLRRNHAIEFVDNIDPATLARVFDGRDLTRISWLMISKSGETVETLATILSVIGMYMRAGLLPDLAERAAVITGAGDSSLRQLAMQYGWRIFEHPDWWAV
jgi:glucose-6-phosphate isomerase